MIFSTYLFIFIFLPIVFVLFWLCLNFNRPNAAKIVLVVSSLFFYAYGAGDFFPYFCMSVFGNYLFGRILASKKGVHEKPIYLNVTLYIGLLLNIMLLGYFKYYDFAIYNLNLLPDVDLPYRNILLPIGISFFTFQLIAYLVDSYRGETKGYGFLDYLMFITFFPQLIVGPIVHHKDVVPQYNAFSTANLSLDSVARGSFLFFLGATKKLLLADPLSGWAQNGFDNASALGTLESWMSSLSYTFSYYFDLSGYADMAIGLGIIFGIKLPQNFNSPYKARNFADYWRRWHMTLSKFLGDYIFRNIFKKGAGDFNFYFAIFVTFFISGFWHGAGWTFVVWGVINGVFVIMAHMMTKADLKLPLILAWLLTMFGVVGTRVLFVANDFSDAWHVLKSMVVLDGVFTLDQTYIATLQPLYLLLGFVLVLAFPNSTQLMSRFQYNYKYMAAFALFIVLSLLNMSYVRGFLYFQF